MKWVKRQWAKVIGKIENSRLWKRWSSEDWDPAPRKKTWWVTRAAALMALLSMTFMGAFAWGTVVGERNAPVRVVEVAAMPNMGASMTVPMAVAEGWKVRAEDCELRLALAKEIPSMKVTEAPEVAEPAIAVPAPVPAVRGYKAKAKKPEPSALDKATSYVGSFF